MTTILNAVNSATAAHGNLTQPLQSAAVVPMDSTKGKDTAQGNRWCKLIKKGENSKLAASVAVEIPAVENLPQGLEQYPAIMAHLVAAYQQLENEAVKAQIIAGAGIVQYSSLGLAQLEAVAAASNEASGIGQLSEERIANWFDAECRDLYLVAIAERLGVADTATDADVKRCEQVANQTRDNLKKLSSKKPVMFDERVRKALLWALEVTDSGDSMTARLAEKLNQKVDTVDMIAALGF